MTTGLSPSLFSGGECPTHGERNQLTTQTADPGFRSQTPEHSDMCTGPASDNNAPKQGLRPWFTPEETPDGQPIAIDHLVRRRETRQRKRHESLFTRSHQLRTGTGKHHTQCLPPQAPRHCTTLELVSMNSYCSLCYWAFYYY